MMQTPPTLTTRTTAAGLAVPRTRFAGAAMMAGAAVFAAAGYFAGEPSGTAAYTVSNVAGLIAIACVLVGFGGFRRRYRTLLGRLGAWGIGLVRFGLLATVLGYLVNLVGPLLPGQAAAAVAVVGIPAWSLAHLMYVGATVLGIACLRSGAVPRLVGVPLVCGLPLLLAGVGLGLAVGGTAATVITWIATEGQAGLAWFLVGLQLSRRAAN
ncbi:hypothetical protein EXU48_19225 [Occultella glacieicola]|uniref:Uncharacterized protein n=1 Tax=Occultella glacieicola TaxID=2518684 RepID=A0ABY2DZD2_9MICO|nr:hypothetical protein [Occultella glacieicola]TDE90051.1 hypothetical protein EXU48_19225 [Occultella glacieicola]